MVFSLCKEVSLMMVTTPLMLFVAFQPVFCRSEAQSCEGLGKLLCVQGSIVHG